MGHSRRAFTALVRRTAPAVLLSALMAIGSCTRGNPTRSETESGNSDSTKTSTFDLPVSMPSNGACAKVPPGFDYNPLYHWSAPTLTAHHEVTSMADSGSGTLREKLTIATNGQVVQISPSLSGTTIRLESELYVKSSITIDGSRAPGVTLDAQGKCRIMTTAKAKDVKIYGIHFQNGYSEQSGGAIHAGQTDQNQSGGRLTIRGCRFTSNTGGRGGAIRVGWRTEGIIEDCLFAQNDGTIGNETNRGKSGGAISTDQSARLTVRRCRFVKNKGHNGGAIYNILQPMVVDSCVFIDNTAETSGAIFTDGGNPGGPGNDPANTGEVTLRFLRIHGSSGSSVGGAMLLWCYPGDIITIEHSIFYDNEVFAGGNGGKGGAARIHNPGSLTIRNTTFAENRAYQQGGALWIDGYGPVTMENVTFSGNACQTDAGGGFNYNGTGVVRINGALFAENYGGRACGAFWFGKRDLDIVVKNTIFAFNEAGKDIGQRHMGYRPSFDGGILEYVDTLPNKGRVTDQSTFADPLLHELCEIDGMMGRPLIEGSPAIGTATSSAPVTDARFAPRDQSPDIGPFEFGVVCRWKIIAPADESHSPKGFHGL